MEIRELTRVDADTTDAMRELDGALVLSETRTMSRSQRRLVVVSGAPGAGKTTLAVPLAERLGMPLFAKDILKETLHDVIGDTDTDRWESSRTLGSAAMTLIWQLARYAPAAVVEANFRSHSNFERRRLSELTDRPVEVFCRLPSAIAAERFAARARTENHHPAHVAESMPVEWFAQFQSPFALGPVIEVDTTGPVDLREVARRVSAALPTR